MLSPTKVKRVVGFNTRSHPDLQHYAQSKTPVLIKNVTVNEYDEMFFNHQSYLHPAQNSDVSFTYIEQQKPAQNTTDKPPSVDVTVSEIPSLKSNQRVNISTTITIGKKDAKKVLLKSTQQDSFVKEDCVIEDSTGTIMAHIWAPLIDEVKDGQAYLFKNMTIKNFQGSTFVGTSPQTSISAVTQTLESLAGPDILSNPDLEITIPKIKFVTKLTIYASCQVCKKRINDLSMLYVGLPVPP